MELIKDVGWGAVVALTVAFTLGLYGLFVLIDSAVVSWRRKRRLEKRLRRLL